jgi:hypothetical protein
MENIKEKVSETFKKLSMYIIISLSFAVGISIGYYYDVIKTNCSNQLSVTSVKREEVKLAIDENNNLLVIKKKDGSYTAYEDSVGYTIFNLYAKNIWGQASSKNNDN